MPQNPIAVAQVPNENGTLNVLNIAASQVIGPVGRRRFGSVIVTSFGSSGSLSFYDTTTVAAAAAANLIAVVNSNSIDGTGIPIPFNWPCQNGLVVVVAGSATGSVAYS